MIDSRPSLPADARPSPEAAAPRLRLGTRGSALAVAQSSTVADALRALGAEVELITVRTLGDDRPPDTTWGEGAFVGALESGLLDGTIDLAVHSAKDVPTTEHPRLTIAAYPERADPRDAIVGREPGTTLASLPHGARVGTDSPRRSAFLRAVRPDLQLHPLHGNVDTRLRRLDEGATDALVLAVAGLTRLGRGDRIGEILPAELCPPAPGQGALAIQCRSDDAIARSVIALLDDPATRAAVEAEREFLRATGGGCRAPIGALAAVEGDLLILRGATAGTTAPDVAEGGRPLLARGETRGPVAGRLALAADLAARLTAELAGHDGPASAGPTATSSSATSTSSTRNPSAGTAWPRVLVTRRAAQAEPLVAAIAAQELEAIVIPTIEIQPLEADADLDGAVVRAAGADWIAITSGNAVGPVLDAAARLGIDLGGPRWAAVGPASKAALEARGLTVTFVPTIPEAAALAAELPIRRGGAVFLPRTDIADWRLVAALEARGASVDAAVAYRTIEGPQSSREALRALFAGGGPVAILFASASAVRGLSILLGRAHLDLARRAVACCVGEPTAKAARTAGFELVLVAPAVEPATLAHLVRTALPVRPGDAAPSARPEDLA
ncbi:MAG: hydroxymethylbilane synthase [Chloroflexi bacterium]|nr:hydroxymethylbilane synthase [Chloroflexota bacterium]